MAKELAKVQISHNDIGEIERGTWRKFNPYNPYVEENEKSEVQDLKIDSLDDLFDDDPIKDTDNDSVKEPIKEPVATNKAEDLKPISHIEPIEDDAPILPWSSDSEEEYDLQKELEAKFDELFGPIDDDENN